MHLNNQLSALEDLHLAAENYISQGLNIHLVELEESVKRGPDGSLTNQGNRYVMLETLRDTNNPGGMSMSI